MSGEWGRSGSKANGFKVHTLTHTSELRATFNAPAERVRLIKHISSAMLIVANAPRWLSGGFL